jgi:hypothetical protein
MGGQYKSPPAPGYREYSWPTLDQRGAYVAALHQLFALYPARFKWQEFERSEAISNAQRGGFVLARRDAIAGGVPEDHLTSIEALLF